MGQTAREVSVLFLRMPSDYAYDVADEATDAGPSDGVQRELTEKEEDLKELMDLQRKYRMMMGDRKAFDKHAKSRLRQQNATLNRLQNENTSIKTELGAQVPKGTSKQLCEFPHLVELSCNQRTLLQQHQLVD